MWLPSFNPGTVRSDPHTGGRLQHFGQRVKVTLLNSPCMRCAICRAELTPEEYGDCSCSDRTACSQRHFAQRCW
jgi:uncharacterized CHY-type Zn-finger protein